MSGNVVKVPSLGGVERGYEMDGHHGEVGPAHAAAFNRAIKAEFYGRTSKLHTPVKKSTHFFPAKHGKFPRSTDPSCIGTLASIQHLPGSLCRKECRR